jgi:TPR repeat protein
MIRRVVSARAAVLILVAIVFGMPPAHAQTVDPRLTEAIGWYTGTAGQVDDSRAHALLLEAAADHDPLSRMWLARCYSTGRMQFERDSARARAIASEVLATIRDLAARGVVEAIFLMGTAYDEGLGAKVSPEEAARWYRRAADRGHVLAQHNLGNLYEVGRGVPEDEALAVVWWRKAAEQGDAIPMLRLGTMYEEGRGVARDLEQAKAWYGRSAARGNARAKEALARLGQPTSGQGSRAPAARARTRSSVTSSASRVLASQRYAAS